MALTRPTRILALPAVKALAGVLFVIFVAVLVVCLVYYCFASDEPSELDELKVVQDDKEEIKSAFTIAATIGIVGGLLAGIAVGIPTLDKLEVVEPRQPMREQQVIDLYNNLPQNALIHCDIDAYNAFEECTVLLRGVSWFSGLFGEPKSTIQHIIDTENRDLVQCCTDAATKTTIFTTKSKSKVKEHNSKMTAAECLRHKCSDATIKGKIARNKLYIRLLAKSSARCQTAFAGTPNSFLVLYDNRHVGYKFTVTFKCGDTPVNGMATVDLPKLYNTIFIDPRYKMAVVQDYSPPLDHHGRPVRGANDPKLVLLVPSNDDLNFDIQGPLEKVLNTLGP